MFKPSMQNRIFEDIVGQIQGAILDGKLKVGDRLPGERRLIETFQVSRGTLREALRALEQRGLITIKTGVKGGAIVCPIGTKLMSNSLDLLLQYQKVSLKELAEFREVIEPFVAAKAVQKATTDDIDRLRLILEQIRNYLDSREPKWNELISEDTKFHLVLTDIAGNRVFQSILSTIYLNINHYFDQFLPKDIQILEGIYKDFSRVVSAIEKRNSSQAKRIVYSHVRRFNLMMEKSGEQEKNDEPKQKY